MDFGSVLGHVEEYFGVFESIANVSGTVDMISRTCVFFFPKCPLTYDIEDHLLKSSDINTQN